MTNTNNTRTEAEWGPNWDAAARQFAADNKMALVLRTNGKWTRFLLWNGKVSRRTFPIGSWAMRPEHTKVAKVSID